MVLLILWNMWFNFGPKKEVSGKKILTWDSEFLKVFRIWPKDKK